MINKTKTNIEDLNQRFFLILENFVPSYIKYLQYPQDTEIANDINYVKGVVTEIESDGFIIKNNMESTIAMDQEKINKLNIEINRLKIENEKLKTREKYLKTTSVTSVGLFDDELEWYKIQIKMIVVLMIGFIIGGKLYYGLQLTNWEHIKTIAIVFLIGIVFETLVMYLYNKIRYGSSDKEK